MQGWIVQGRIVWGRIVQGQIVPVPDGTGQILHIIATKTLILKGAADIGRYHHTLFLYMDQIVHES